MKSKISIYKGISESKLDTADLQKIKEYKNRFRVWQGRQIDLLNWSINILFTINVAIIGYWCNLYVTNKFSDSSLYSFKYYNIAIILLIASLFFGVFSLWNRLDDFRNTLIILEKRRLKLQVEKGLTYYSDKLENTEDIENEILRIRNENTEKGLMTHCFFKIQLVLFAMGLILLTISI